MKGATAMENGRRASNSHISGLGWLLFMATGSNPMNIFGAEVGRRWKARLAVIAGYCCIVVGFILWPLPIPLGIPLLTLGTFLLVKYSAKGRLYYRHWRPRLKKYEIMAKFFHHFDHFLGKKS